MDVSADCIELEKLSSIAVLPDGGHFHILQKCIVCLENQGHFPPVSLTQRDLRQAPETYEVLEVRWSTPSTDQWRKSYADLNESVEDSAKGIAFLLMHRLGYVFCEQASRGPKIDYYVSRIEQDQDDTLIFNGNTLCGLEITGILSGRPEDVNRRLKKKKDRITNGNGFKPSMVVVVEHSAPQAAIDMAC